MRVSADASESESESKSECESALVCMHVWSAMLVAAGLCVRGVVYVKYRI